MGLLSEGIIFDALTTDPTSPADGYAWYNSTDHKFRIRVNGSSQEWVTNGGGTGKLKSDTLANRPAAGIAGDLYLATDSKALYRDNGTSWDLVGNAPGSGTSAGAKGDVQFRAATAGAFTANANGNFNWDDSAQSLTLGPPGTNLSNNPCSINGNVNSYAQSNVQNINSGIYASSDLVATCDNGNDNNGYVDLGVNSHVNADGTFSITGPRDGYLYCSGSGVGGNLAIGTDAAWDVILFTNGTLAANERARITSGGNVLVGRVALATNATNGFLYLSGSAGVPTGTPTAYSGRAPIAVDTNTGNVYVYTGSAWRMVNAAPTSIVESSTNINITSATDVLVTGMTITPVAGTYLVFFSGDINNTTLNVTGATSIYMGGVQVAASERAYSHVTSTDQSAFSCMAKVTVNGSQAIAGYARTSAGTETIAHCQLVVQAVN